ncbi:hypothetical protein ACIPW5_05325 [Streptomyces sp. NPDC090077]|uniref:hypothetical protein n=1 Tax=Streptomyces sp. NPDC090077 TaxID=3365938 RepID=UPI0037F48001
MGGQNKNLREIGYFVAFASGGVALVGNAVVSTWTVGMVVDAVEAAIPSQASAEDYVKVATVFWASAPIVLATLACVMLVSHYGYQGTGTVALFCIPWLIAGAWSYGVLAPGVDALTALGNTPPVAAGQWTPLAKVVSWAVRPYSLVIGAQGLFLGGVAGIAYLHFTNPERHQG